ncbi:MAG: RluA family pseudouridine synthase [Phormidesmis sp.]
MNSGWTYIDQIKPASAGQTVLSYYTQRYWHSSATVWKGRIQQGDILLNGQPVSPQRVLSGGEKLTYYRLPWQEPNAPLDFEILYEDEDLWAIAKPAGLPVLPGGGFLEHTLLHQMRQRYPNEAPAPVHRLGRGTSGVMLVARSPLAKRGLSQQFRKRQMTKVYRALIGPTEPSLLAEKFTCTYPIGKLPHPRLGYLYGHVPHSKSSLAAQSHGQIVQRTPHSTLLDVSIVTGRPHQIRIHLAAAGYPLLGDPLYGVGGYPLADMATMPGECGYHLHAHRLQFLHPGSGETVLIAAEPPAALQSAAL